jgi:hypothetical protein
MKTYQSPLLLLLEVELLLAAVPDEAGDEPVAVVPAAFCPTLQRLWNQVWMEARSEEAVQAPAAQTPVLPVENGASSAYEQKH